MVLTLPQAAEVAAYLLLMRDAHAHHVSGVSAQTCIGLSVSASLNVLNLPVSRGARWWRTLLASLVVASVGLCCSYMVAKASDAGGEDDIILDGGRLPRWARRSVAYWAAAAMSAVAVLASCGFSASEVLTWTRHLPAGPMCTFQNFLHGTALLHQLMLSRRQGWVAPAAARFLLILGLKHLIEFGLDLSVTWRNFKDGTLELHELSFMSGDLFAAVVLLDYLYLFVAFRSKMIPVCLSSSGFELEKPSE